MRVPIRKSGKYTHLKSDPRITSVKLDELKRGLKKLVEFSRPFAIKEVNRLAEDGDFSENEGYRLAKGRLRSINQRIIDLEDRIDRAIIIDPDRNKDYVQLGNKVTLEFNGKKLTYLILGPSETNPNKNIISDQSPIGALLIGKKIGDQIILKLDNKKQFASIVSIE